MERHVELRLLLQVARITKFRLRLLEQELLHFRMVWRVAGGAAHIVRRVHRVDGLELLTITPMAGQTTVIHFFRRMALAKDKNLADITSALDVRGTRSVAVLAAMLGDATLLECLLPVLALLPILIKLFVASLAGFAAGVIATTRFAFRGIGSFLRAGGLGAR